ncbi:uncharacterized protein [Lolium perenne]|uniref:uncharacterized protein n=1 Tax=Lolium perenne TaxID=4522 RepID=UPI0021F520FE|nr:uncharacterized protein LOC127327746 [Lolium perenne]
MAPPRSASTLDGGAMLNLIFDAAFDGDLPRFKLLVAMLDTGRGRLREAVDALRWADEGMMKGLSPLHVAASRGSMEVCRYLVQDLGVDVNVVDGEGRTPLFWAVLSKNVSAAKYLLDHGANQDMPNHDGFSPLHEAVGSGDCEMVKLLLAKGAYVDPVASCGTPLHVAATQGQDGTMKILLDHNADVNKMVNGKTPMMAALDADSKLCILILMKAGADRESYLAYSGEKLRAANVISADFFNSVMEDAAAGVTPNDDEPLAKRKTRVAGYKAMASYAFKTKDYNNAILTYSLLILLEPADATWFSNRSLCWYHMSDGAKALADANECRRIRPDWPKACYRQGTALMLLKDYKGASQRFCDGLKLDPGNAEIDAALRKALESLRKSRGSKAK